VRRRLSSIRPAPLGVWLTARHPDPSGSDRWLVEIRSFKIAHSTGLGRHVLLSAQRIGVQGISGQRCLHAGENPRHLRSVACLHHQFSDAGPGGRLFGRSTGRDSQPAVPQTGLSCLPPDSMGTRRDSGTVTRRIAASRSPCRPISPPRTPWAHAGTVAQWHSDPSNRRFTLSMSPHLSPPDPMGTRRDSGTVAQ
jgi:hypothetical protein